MNDTCVVDMSSSSRKLHGWRRVFNYPREMENQYHLLSGPNLREKGHARKIPINDVMNNEQIRKLLRIDNYKRQYRGHLLKEHPNKGGSATMNPQITKILYEKGLRYLQGKKSHLEILNSNVNNQSNNSGNSLSGMWSRSSRSSRSSGNSRNTASSSGRPRISNENVRQMVGSLTPTHLELLSDYLGFYETKHADLRNPAPLRKGKNETNAHFAARVVTTKLKREENKKILNAVEDALAHNMSTKLPHWNAMSSARKDYFLKLAAPRVMKHQQNGFPTSNFVNVVTNFKKPNNRLGNGGYLEMARRPNIHTNKNLRNAMKIAGLEGRSQLLLKSSHSPPSSPPRKRSVSPSPNAQKKKKRQRIVPEKMVFTANNPFKNL